MRYQIDQSIKIENTNKTTYVCLTNGKVALVRITAREKQTLKGYFRKLERPLIFKLFTFSVLCAKVLSVVNPAYVQIDTEYVGHEIDIKSFIVQILKIWHIPQPDINFAQIGKNSSAHTHVYAAYQKRQKIKEVDSREVLVLYRLVNKA